MAVIHCNKADLAIYVPPKCGTQIIEKIIDFPELKGLFYMDPKADALPRKNRIVVLRNHLDRILSVYYDKIVDPTFNATASPGWRSRNYDSPTEFGFHPDGYKDFQTFLLNLGINTECRMYNQFVTHTLPYVNDPVSTFAYMLASGQGWHAGSVNMLTAWTHDLKDKFIGTLFTQLMSAELPLAFDPLQPRGLNDILYHQLQDKWENLTTPHKINYSNDLPSPSDYGSDSWSTVSWQKLFECSQDTGYLPSRNLMYNDLCTAIVNAQIGYRLDNHEINSGIDPEERHNLLSLRS